MEVSGVQQPFRWPRKGSVWRQRQLGFPLGLHVPALAPASPVDLGMSLRLCLEGLDTEIMMVTVLRRVTWGHPMEGAPIYRQLG